MIKATLSKVYWKDMRKDVLNLNPNLGKIIDQINPNDSYPLYLASYPYGSVIVNEGVFNLPNSEG